jgi:hypothetical protein
LIVLMFPTVCLAVVLLHFAFFILQFAFFLYWFSASAPPTTSNSSDVICPCRARL